jgi:hypothetical protein
MTAEPTSLGIGIVAASLLAFFLWVRRRLKRRRRARQKERPLAIAK